ncbi:hypothetical protein O4H52_07870 [Sphingomonadaceae bacterium G21617-S1]|nr:hypothetical protein [Sphingomonadaceae bacterium G21617-S1]
MGQKVATIGIDLEMTTSGAKAELSSFGGAVDKVTAKAIQEFGRIDTAVESMADTTAAVAAINKIADASAKTAAQITRERNSSHAAGERMVAQLERQISAYGKTTDEVRSMRAETAALRAEQNGQSELAERIRAKEQQLYDLEYAAMRRARVEAEALADEKAAAAAQAVQAAEREANALRAAAVAHQMFEARVREGAAAMRAADAAAEADAVTMQRLRALLDPAAVSQEKLNQELAEARRVMLAAGASAEELARAELMLTKQHQGVIASTGQVKAGQQQLMYNLNDAATMWGMQAPVMQIFVSQAGQTIQAIQLMSSESKGLLGLLGGPWGMAFTTAAVVMVPLIASLFDGGDAADDLSEKQQALASYLDKTTGKIREQIGALAMLSRARDLADEQKKNLENYRNQRGNINTSVIGAFQPIETSDPLYGPQVQQTRLSLDKAAQTQVTGFLKQYQDGLITVQQLYGKVADAAKSNPGLDGLSRDLLKVATSTEAAAQRVRQNAIEQARLAVATGVATEAQRAMVAQNTISTTSTSRLIDLQVAAATAATPLQKAQAELALVKERGAVADKAGGAALEKYRADLTAAEQAVNTATAAQRSATAARREANKAETEAQRLARDASATEAKITNLNALADAYRMSGGAALEAQIRAKAQSDAIRKGADEDAYVARQIRLGLAQYTADAQKAATATGEQARIQEEVNRQVAAGIIPASRAGEFVRDRIAELPVLAAIELAQSKGYTTAAAAATQALDAQRAGRMRLTAAEVEARLASSLAANDDEIERIQLETRLIGANTVERLRQVAALKAWQEVQDSVASGSLSIDGALEYVAAQVRIAEQQDALTAGQERFDQLLPQSEDAVKRYAEAFGQSFGRIGQSIASVTAILIDHGATQRQIDKDREVALARAGDNAAKAARAEKEYSRQSADNQIGAYADITGAAKGMFSERSKIYKGLQAAETIFRAVQLALSIQAMVQNAAETAATIANAGVRATAEGTAGIASQSKLPFPLNIAAMAATAAALVGFGVAVLGGGGGGSAPSYNEGKGTVFGDAGATSDSIKRSIDVLGDIDTELLGVSRQMASSLKAIEGNIGGLTNLVIRLGGADGIGANAEAGVKTGFNSALPGVYTSGAMSAAAVGMLVGGPIGAAIGVALTKVPIIGDILGGIGAVIGSLFGSKTKIVGSGIYGTPQSIGDIDSMGFDGQTFADVQKKKKFFGVTTSTKYSTRYGDLDGQLEDQFGKLLLSFADAIKLAAGPLGLSLDDIDGKLAGFVVDIGKIDLKDLTGEEIQEKLTAVFGAQADKMAEFAIGGLSQFQKVGEGYFETLIRVASTVEVVTSSLQLLGLSATSLGTDASMAIADMFDGAAGYQDAAGRYFELFYSDSEQAAAKTEQLGKVFDSLGIAMPESIASFRALVEAQDLTTAAGQETYAALLQLAPAFAEIVSSGTNASSAAAILRERNDLERQLMELQGDTAGIRAAELEQLNPSNRALQERIYALQDEADAARVATQAAQELAAQQRAVAQERAGLERQLLQLNNNTAALRELDLQNVDESNQDLLKQIWARQDAIAAEQAAQAAAAEAQRQAEQAAAEAQRQADEAARAAQQLADAWAAIGDSIMEEVKRIRGDMLTEAQSYQQLQAEFNAATDAARLGNEEAAKALPELSRAMLAAAADAATDSLMLKRIQDVTAASLEQTYGVIAAAMGFGDPQATPSQQLQNFVDGTRATSSSAPANDTAAEIRALRAEVAQLRTENNSGHAKTADEANGSRKVLERSQAWAGDGNSLSVMVAA